MRAKQTLTRESNVWVQVQRVIDGDTIKLEDGQDVRLIGINAPETGRPGAAEATQFAKGKVEGKKVWLESDGNDTSIGERLRRYVWLQQPSSQPDENQIRRYMLNALLISNGFAKADGNNHRYAALFQQL